MSESILPPLPQGPPPSLSIELAPSSSASPPLPGAPPPSPVKLSAVDELIIEDAQNAVTAKLLGLFKDKLQKMLCSKITPLNVALAAAYAMEIVERSKIGTGSSKKHMVISLLEEYVKTTDISEEDKAPLLLLIETTVPGLIDTAADIANGKFKINLKSWCCFTC